MASQPPEVGSEATGYEVVGPEHFASRVVEGTPDVYGTASLGALVEKTAADWLHGFIEPDEMTVGTSITINHTAATPAGKRVTVTVRLEAADPPRYDFSWTAHDEIEEVGSGTHQRFVLDRDRFLRGLDRKR